MTGPIKFDHITAYLIKIPLIRPFRISVGQVTEKEFMVIEGRAGDITGWGEASVDGTPFYTYETSETSMIIGRRVLAPLLMSKPWNSPEELVEEMEHHRGHYFTKMAFETLLWDVYGKMLGKPVSQYPDEVGAVAREWVETGPSIGIKDSPEKLVEAVAADLGRGYRRIKIKVSPGKDIPYIEAVRKAYPDITLMVDANSAYQPEDIEKIARWDDYNLLMIEQPLDEFDLYFHAKLAARMKTPICLDESIPTLHLVKCAIDIKAMDILNIKVGRVGGLVRTRQINKLCEEAGIPVWIGARLGSGIADSMNLAAASLPNAKFPSDTGFGFEYLSGELIQGWFDIRNKIEYKVPTLPGLGVEVDREMLNKYTVYKEEWSA